MVLVCFGVAIVMVLIDVHMQMRMLSKQPFPAGFGDCRIIQVERFQMGHGRQRLETLRRSQRCQSDERRAAIRSTRFRGSLHCPEIEDPSRNCRSSGNRRQRGNAFGGAVGMWQVQEPQRFASSTAVSILRHGSAKVAAANAAVWEEFAIVLMRLIGNDPLSRISVSKDSRSPICANHCILDRKFRHMQLVQLRRC